MTRKERVSLVSLFASVGLTLAKLVVGLMIGSLALITDALHSGTDAIATLVTFLAVRFADRPADDDHPYGHGKFEDLAALGEGTLLLVLAGGVAMEAWNRFAVAAPPPSVGVVAFAVLGVEIAINLWRAWALNKAAKETGSRALAADAMHFLSDVASSVIVIVGFVATLYGVDWADLGFVCDGRFLFTQRSLEQTPLPPAFRAFLPQAGVTWWDKLKKLF